MSNLIVEILDRTDTSLDQLSALFGNYYRGMEAQGLLLPLVEGGEILWLKSIRAGLGKYYNVIVARDGEEIVGFLYGFVKVTPPYLGSKLIGYADSIYLKEPYRRGNTVIRMIRLLERWLREKHVHSCELQVLIENTHTRDIWQGMGYSIELYQMRKIFRYGQRE